MRSKVSKTECIAGTTMAISAEALEQFREMYRKRYGVMLSDSELLERATRLLNLYRIVYADQLNISMNQKNGKEIRRKENNQ